ncbi:MBL fold metallo-hydrolase [Rubellimicrobium arenae]|uniref:MBL fold metallo-hydrolase n=1 Tax=Rubellimicrobium arenae TaxID=2817372 RepID=UPI001B30D54A|nr:MBL fold metallo-hydrolase [Rubellimicrobium arenae]
MTRRNRYYDGPVSGHFDGNRFFSHDEPPRRGMATHLRMVRGQIARRWTAPPRPVRPVVPPQRVAALRVTSIGHSSLLVQVAGHNLLIDPVFAEWLGPWPHSGPRRAHPPGIRWEDLPPIDAILLTHNHWDHLDGPGIARLWARFAPRILAPLGNDAVLRRYDRAMPVETLDWGQGLRLSDGLSVHLEPALHWSGRSLWDRRMALWGSYVLTGAGGVLYHVGDTSYGDGSIFRRIREVYGPPDLALIPIGAYEPRWYVGTQHVDPEEAVRIMLDCGARRALGHHWGTFQLTWEEADAPPRDLAAALARHDLPPERFQPLQPGEPVDLPWP